MKKIIFLATTLLLLLAGCGNDPVQEDLINYVNEDLPAVAKLEKDAMDAYDSVTGSNYTDDLTTYNTIIEEVIPTYNEFIKELEAISVETDAVSKIHEQYIDVANLQSSAFVNITDALEKGDMGLIADANDQLTDARKGMREYQSDLKKLAKDHDVTFDKK